MRLVRLVVSILAPLFLSPTPRLPGRPHQLYRMTPRLSVASNLPLQLWEDKPHHSSEC